jgi:hypothetical protein
MSTQVQYRRGSNVQVAAFTGALGELVVDTTNKVVVVNDGVTVGGFPLAGTTASQTITNKIYQGTSLSVSGNVTGGNINTGGVISATGNIIGGNILGTIVGTISTTSASVSGNITGGNLLTGGLISATGNITGGNILGGANVNATTHTGTTVSVTGNITGGNILGGANVNATTHTGTTVSVSANVTGGNILTGGLISATGNITGNYILGNGSQLTGIDATSIQSGTSNVRVVSSGGNVTTSVGGTSNVVVVASTGQYVTGLISSSGNVTAANFVTSGVVSAAGNITGANLSISGTVTSGPMNITGNITVTGNINATGNLNYQNVTDLVVGDPLIYLGANAVGDVDDLGFVVNWDTAPTGYQHGGFARDATDGVWKLFGNVVAEPTTTIDFTNAIYQPIRTGAITATSGAYSLTLSATGNITGGNVLTGGLISATGNITGGNVLTGGLISATGNITGGNILGGANVNATTHTGTTVSVSANITGGNILTAGLISATGTITSAGNLSLTGNIVDGGEMWINTSSNGNINLNPNGTGTTNIPVGVLSVTGNIQGGNLRTAGLVSASGTVTAGGDLSLVGNIVDTGPLTIITSSNGNITLSPNGTGNINTGANIMPTANATANIGSATLSYNTIFAKATSAQYADLAEMYCADATYAPGTVVEFGGNEEITISGESHSTRVAGIISTNPSYLMNSALDCTNALEVALVGRVPCQVVGTIRKGDRLVSSEIPGVATVLDPVKYQPGCIIGKALEAYDSINTGVIEVAVGRT